MAPDHFPDLDLSPLMDPKVIGIVGASQRKSRGTRVLDNLQSFGFEGSIYPINPRYDEIQGVKCYPTVADVPETIDTLVVAIPGAGVPDLLAEARSAGTRAAVVLSSGFREAGPEGLERHRRLEELALGGMPICGPNCYGILNLATRAAPFSGRIPDPPRVGPLAFVSQSGGFTNMIVNPLVEDRGLGFKYMVSCGNQAGARVEDYLRYLVEDPDIEAIGAFVEGLSSVKALIEVGLRARELDKTIVMLKSGRSAVAQAAVASHTGSIAGASEVVDAALKKAGVISVTSLDELAEVLALVAVGDPRRIGRRVLVVTGSGGESSHAADAAERGGVELPDLTESSAARLRDDVLPDFGNPRNPLDGTGAMFENPAVFPGLIAVAVEDENVDLVAVNLGQRPPEGPWAPMRNFAQNIAELPDEARAKVIGFGSMSTGPIDDVLIQTLIDAGVPFLAGSGYAMRAIGLVAEANEASQRPEPTTKRKQAPRTWPTEKLDAMSAWELLESYGVPVVGMERVSSAATAVEAAERLGMPVAMKIASFDVSHKSDIGGVALGVDTLDDVRATYDKIVAAARTAIDGPESADVIIQAMAPPGVELLVGIVRDAALGPAVVVGTGGIFVELLHDAKVVIPPVSPDEARELLATLRGYPLLKGVRGSEAADVDAAAELISNVGELALDMPESIHAIDLNPIMVHPAGQGVSCVDVWVEKSPVTN